VLTSSSLIKLFALATLEQAIAMDIRTASPPDSCTSGMCFNEMAYLSICLGKTLERQQLSPHGLRPHAAPMLCSSLSDVIKLSINRNVSK
jgi:hypothetical protein